MKYKRKINRGIMFLEKSSLRMFEEEAKKGWFLDKIGLINMRFIKGEPKEMQYDLEYVHNYGNEDFIETFEDAGWKLVTKADKDTCVFSAEVGVTPMYTHEGNKYTNFTNRLKFGVIFSALLALIINGCSIWLEKLNMLNSELNIVWLYEIFNFVGALAIGILGVNILGFLSFKIKENYELKRRI